MQHFIKIIVDQLEIMPTLRKVSIYQLRFLILICKHNLTVFLIVNTVFKICIMRILLYPMVTGARTHAIFYLSCSDI
jgi:hypothetical protein